MQEIRGTSRRIQDTYLSEYKGFETGPKPAVGSKLACKSSVIRREHLNTLEIYSVGTLRGK